MYALSEAFLQQGATAKLPISQSGRAGGGTHTDQPAWEFALNVNSEQTRTSCLSNVTFLKEL